MIRPSLRGGRGPAWHYVTASLRWPTGIIAVTPPRRRPLPSQVTCAVLSGDARSCLTRHRRLDVPGCYQIYGPEEAAMITHTTVQALGQARLADLHDQARRDALVHAARRARRQRSQAVPGSANPAAKTSIGRPRKVIRDA